MTKSGMCQTDTMNAMQYFFCLKFHSIRKKNYLYTLENDKPTQQYGKQKFSDHC